MQKNIIGKNLRLLRDGKGWSQKKLAEASAMSLPGLKKIESGSTLEPQYTTLKSLASTLGVKVEAFFQPIPQLNRVRFRSSVQLKNRDQILVRVGRWLESYNRLEKLLEETQPCSLTPNENRPRGKKQRQTWAKEQAAHIRKEMGIDDRSPIRDIRGLLESQGIKIYTFSLANHGFFGLSVSQSEGGPAIAINTWERITVERWIFTTAHELGHLILHEGDYDVDELEKEEDHEHEANIFASHFLIPSEVFQDEWQQSSGISFVDRVLKVKHMFRVSYKTILWRLVEEGLVDRHAWSRFRSDYLERYGKSLTDFEEPEALSAGAFLASIPESRSGQEPFGISRFEFIGSRLHGLVKKALENGEVTWLYAAGLLGISLKEMRKLAEEWGEA